jgi:hypothetical protein
MLDLGDSGNLHATLGVPQMAEMGTSCIENCRRLIHSFHWGAHLRVFGSYAEAAHRKGFFPFQKTYETDYARWVSVSID